TPGERAEMLLKLADALDQHADELAELESQNVGKPLGSAKDEMPVASDNIRFFAGAARVLEGKSAGEYMRGYSSWLRREPIGIVGGIAPWNYPLMMAVWKLAPALAAGNVPFSAAFATVPVLVMAVYLLIARKLGAFEAL
ncbi:MAG: aldehyde dehydrogenase family protein, partial [Actinobacteria bacterium]